MGNLARTVHSAVRGSRGWATRIAAAGAFLVALAPALVGFTWLRFLATAVVVALAATLHGTVLARSEHGVGLDELGVGGRGRLAWRVAAMELLAVGYLLVLDAFATPLAAVTLVPVAFAATRGSGLDAGITSGGSAAVVAIGALVTGSGPLGVAAAAGVGAAGLFIALAGGVLRQSAVDFSALYETGRALSSSLRQEDLLMLLLDIAMADLGADAGMVFLTDRETGQYELAASRGTPEDYRPTSRDVDRSICDWAVRHRGPCLKTKDLMDDPVLAGIGRPVGTAIAVPLVSGSGTSGVIVATAKARDAFTTENARFLEALAVQAATALENAQLYRQTAYWAIRDGLTGLFNYRHFAERLEIELARAARYQKPLSLLVIDVDLFKRVNDDFGHLVGDEALRELAARLADNTRDTDVVARYGGEEFAVILPETDYDDAARVAEKLRSAVASKPMVDVGPGPGPGQTRIDLTISIGLATFPTTAQADHLVSQADEALYDAKVRRDCVCSVRGCVG